MAKRHLKIYSIVAVPCIVLFCGQKESEKMFELSDVIDIPPKNKRYLLKR